MKFYQTSLPQEKRRDKYIHCNCFGSEKVKVKEVISKTLVFIFQPSIIVKRQSCADKSKILIRKNEKQMAVASAVPL